MNMCIVCGKITEAQTCNCGNHKGYTIPLMEVSQYRSEESDGVIICQEEDQRKISKK